MDFKGVLGGVKVRFQGSCGMNGKGGSRGTSIENPSQYWQQKRGRKLEAELRNEVEGSFVGFFFFPF